MSVRAKHGKFFSALIAWLTCAENHASNVRESDAKDLQK